MSLVNNIDKYNRITGSLYIGNFESPHDKDFLVENNIKLIVNCTKTYNYKLPSNIQKIRLNITDVNTPENNIIIANNIDKILEIINIYLKSEEGVLVHCHMGQQRSAAVIVCYLMKYKKLSLKEAINKVKSKRKMAFNPQATFLDFLQYYEIEVS